MSRRYLQPFLNDEEVVVAAPTQVWSEPGGGYGDKAIHGVYHGDWRYVRAARLEVDGLPPETAGTQRWRGGRLALGLARGGPDGDVVDPRMLIRWSRQVTPGRVVETVMLHNGRNTAVSTALELTLEVEFGELQHIKAGDPRPVPCRFEETAAGIAATDGKRRLLVAAAHGRITRDGSRVRVTAHLTVPAHGSTEFSVRLELADASGVVRAGWAPIAQLPASGDRALDAWARQALDDCRSLLLDTGEGPFVAAGAPWFLTLFGRDSLISARFLLPVAPRIALGTLRTLAARQGRRIDRDSAEQPGKILHELRAGELRLPDEGVRLPPVYYGTVDATALWIILLHDTWRSGVEEDQILPLLGNLEAALAWLRDYARPGDSGFLRYFDESGHGLANQGWKDSGDAIRFRDGRVAEGPIALSEVQAQACLAAECGADLLDAYGGDGSLWRVWAADLRDRFRATFWVERDGQRFPAVALDGSNVPVDAMTSNMGQLIGTTLLNADEEALVARLLLDPRLSSGFGLRTMAAGERGFWPLSYHCGSVWVHDTAIAIEGLLRAGLPGPARQLAEQLLRAVESFDWRAPELFGGFSAAEATRPVSYPASCRPQGWAAAAVVPVYRALTLTQTSDRGGSRERAGERR